MQTIMITGYIGQDAVLDSFNNGRGNETVIRFRVGVNNRYTNRAGQLLDEATWYSCSLFNANPNVASMLLQGRRVYVQGIPRTRPYQRRDGTWDVSNDIRVTLYEFQDANPNGQGNYGSGAIPAGAQMQNSSVVTRPNEYQQPAAEPQTMVATTPGLPNPMMQPQQPQQPMFPNAAPDLPTQNPVNQETEQPQQAALPY